MNRFSRVLTAGVLALAGLSSMSAATFVGERADFRDETIYFAMTTRFYDGDPKNNVCGWDRQNVQIANNDPDWRGDFKGLIDKLDYIKALGFTAIWITPVVQNASGTDFHGYHAMDFSRVDLRYESRKSWGSSEDVTFQSLIDAAHKRGMKVILDIVLNHTGNFGEDHFAHLFDRSQNIKNQASVEASLIPDQEKLGGQAYWKLDPNTQQYPTRFKYLKNTDGKNHDNHNYWHHLATAWNWDYPSRWWGQIAGDCVDLNTENPAVAEYLVKCYGKFIEMGVDGFRIDTTGHISRLTFNTSFIPQFLEIAEKNKSKRNGSPFFMFGECCARFSDVTYRDQPNLSSYFYTWKSPTSLTSKWNYDASYWDTITILEGNDNQYGNQLLCLEEPSVKQESDNAFMKNGAWHKPDYSQYSGFSIIDFPMHYNFNNASAAVNVAKSGDKYYNDATYNVVYVDSHDYCPGPNDGTRFNGGTEQWAENLALMFTFRGIPCIYYGTEVEFQKGCKVDAGGTDMPVKQSGRAYFGHYIEGSLTTTDFGVYSNAQGNLAKTLNGDLSQHIIRLNKIRAAVPALRRGQYTFDGCAAKGGWAFKRATEDSYALVCINGGAEFTGVPAGTYVDLVTGTSYTPVSGKITVTAPTNKGQLRVLVKDWKGGIIGEDGKFIYNTKAVAHGGSVSFTDPGATEFYTSADAEPMAGVTLSPAGGSFKTESITVTASLNSSAVSGSYKIGSAAAVTLTPGKTSTFTIGKDLDFGQSVTVTWTAKDASGETYNGSATYKKVDPNATITVYVTAPSAPNLYAWGKNSSGGSVEPCGEWPGTTLSQTSLVEGRTFYYYTFDDMDEVNIIFNKDGSKTGNIEGITEDTYFEYDGQTTATKIDINAPKVPSVRFSPNGGRFSGTVQVSVNYVNATSAWYKVGNGNQITIPSSGTSFTLGDKMADGESVTVSWSATGDEGTRTGSVTFTKNENSAPAGITVFYDNSITNWSPVKVHYWGGDSASSWPGADMERVTGSAYANLWSYTVPSGTTGLVFNNGNGDQTNDITGVENNKVYKGLGNRNFEETGFFTGISFVESDEEAPIEFYTLQGIKVDNPTSGFYIMRQGRSVSKVHLR